MKTEKIMCSAIWIQAKEIKLVHYPTNVDYGIVICGYRHHNCLEMISVMGFRDLSLKSNTVQGFLTNKNRFVDRVEAKKIATKSGQLLNGPIKRSELTSEDVWLIND